MNQKYVLGLSSIRRVKRREVLGFIGSAAVFSLVGCQREDSTADVSAAGSSAQPVAASTTTKETAAVDLPSCIVSPQQTEGPYFVDAGLDRSDIRSDPSDDSVREGVPVRLVLRVSQVSAGTCTPMEGAVVELWHCDAEGVYSDVRDRGVSTVGQKFLRGSQITHSDGTVEFTTIYPGWYPGRAVHAHFKVRNSTAPEGYEFTSQLYFDDALSDQVYAQAPYSSRGKQDMRNERDRIYQDGGEQLTLQLTPEGAGYRGTFNIGLQIS
ncbi:MAG: intradiol ring-cleavage dioxygenase [Phormidesmis sp.]